jgi:hypothetical protein
MDRTVKNSLTFGKKIIQKSPPEISADRVELKKVRTVRKMETNIEVTNLQRHFGSKTCKDYSVNKSLPFGQKIIQENLL